jgi:hypothetical protein
MDFEMPALLTYTLPNYTDLRNLVLPNREAYIEKNNFCHIDMVGPYTNRDWYYAFDRLKFIYDIFFDGYYSESAFEYPEPDVIWCLNAQSVITNLNKKFTDYLVDDKDFYITKDCHVVNAGSFIIRKSDWSKKWLEFILSEEPKYHNDCWQENRVMIHNYEKPEWAEKIAVIPQNTINSYFYSYYAPNWGPETPGDWREGDLCISLPGTSVEKRMQVIPEWLAKVQK